MTREDAIEHGKEQLEIFGGEHKEFIELAIKALEQEPQSFKWCTDCREYDQEKHCCHRWSKVIRDTIEEMKQEQEPKTGHWIPSHISGSILDECSECGFACGAFTFNYCPNCGAKMVEPQESEDT